MKICFCYCHITVSEVLSHFHFQISYSGTSSESREQELSFDTKLDGISGFIVEDMGSLKSVRIYLTGPVEKGQVVLLKSQALKNSTRP